jgi:hypothetical protein
VTEVSTDGAPVTVRTAAALLTFPETAWMCETAGVSEAFWPVPEPFVTGLPSEAQVIVAVKGLLNWSKAVAVKAKVWPGATVWEAGEIAMWSSWGVG